MTLKEIMVYVKANKFIPKFTGIKLTGGIYARLNGKNSQGKDGFEPTEEEQLEMAHGFDKLGDILKKWAAETFTKFGVKK